MSRAEQERSASASASASPESSECRCRCWRIAVGAAGRCEQSREQVRTERRRATRASLALRAAHPFPGAL